MTKEQDMIDWVAAHPYKKEKKRLWIERGVAFFALAAIIMGWVWTSGSINSGQDNLIKFNKELIITETKDRKRIDKENRDLIIANTGAIEKTNKSTNIIIGQLDVMLKHYGLTYEPPKDEEEN